MDVNDLKNKIKSNIIPIAVVVVGILLIVGGIMFSKNKTAKPLEYQPESWNEDGTVKPGTDCTTKTETVKVPAAGSDIYPGGSEIEVEMNYYACNKGERDEVVMIKSPGRDDPLFKWIKMIPGDKYEVKELKDKKFVVKVNGDVMQNSKGEEYTFTERKSRMIKLYESNFKSGIKNGVYFVFGETPAGGFDSTRFGPVTPERMIGRVITKPPTGPTTEK
jgi:hypothetical protein